MLRQLGPLCVAGLAQELVWIAALTLGDLREHTEIFLGLMAVAFVLFIASLVRLPVLNPQGIRLVIGFALLFRFTVLPAPPYQSEDVYRYIWDARVSSSGINPFLYAPDAPELRGLRDAKIYPMINSKSHVTAYPPLSQILFRCCHAAFNDSVIAMKAVFSLLEIATVLLTWRLLRIWGLNLRGILLTAWNPFFIFEFSWSGHSDSAMMFLILLSLYLLSRSRNAGAMVSYAGAVLTKLHPALWFPLFARRTNWKAVLAGIVAGMALALPYFSPRTGLEYFRSLGSYFRLFEFNASVHYLLRYFGRAEFHEQWDQAAGPYLLAVLLLIALLIWWRFPSRRTVDLLHAGFWLMTADLCLATTVHPWYLCWAALALPFFPYAFMICWTGSCFLSYLAYAYRPVFEPTWSLLVEYLPVYGLMIWEICLRKPSLVLRLQAAQRPEAGNGKP